MAYSVLPIAGVLLNTTTPVEFSYTNGSTAVNIPAFGPLGAETFGSDGLRYVFAQAGGAIKQIRGTDKADLIVAGNTMYQYYVASLQAIQRITSEESGAAGFCICFTWKPVSICRTVFIIMIVQRIVVFISSNKSYFSTFWKTRC